MFLPLGLCIGTIYILTYPTEATRTLLSKYIGFAMSKCTRCKTREPREAGKWCEYCLEGRRRWRKTGSALRKSPLIVPLSTGNSYLRLVMDMISNSPYRSCRCCGESSNEVLLITDQEGKAIGRKGILQSMKRDRVKFKVYCANCERAKRFYGKCLTKANHSGR